MTTEQEREAPLQPLQGVRVLELCQGIAGPYCALLLRQLGAEVLKLEPPRGDWARYLGRQKDGMSAIYAAHNAGKHTLSLDTKTEAGRARLLELAQGADIVVQNFRPGVAERMGVGWEQLSPGHPGLIYLSISGWGSEGPMAGAAVLDTAMQAASGMMFANRDADGKPRRIGVLAVDYPTALFGSHAILAALLDKARTGKGRHLQVTMLEAAAAFQMHSVLDSGMFGVQERAVLNAPTGIFEARDGKPLYISMLDDAMFLRLAAAIGAEGWISDKTLRTNAVRMTRVDELVAELRIAIGRQSRDHWLEVLAQHDIVFAPVRHVEELIDDPQACLLEVFQDYHLPGFGVQKLVNMPGGSRPAPALSPAPALGEGSGGWS